MFPDVLCFPVAMFAWRKKNEPEKHVGHLYSQPGGTPGVAG